MQQGPDDAVNRLGLKTGDGVDILPRKRRQRAVWRSSRCASKVLVLAPPFD